MTEHRASMKHEVTIVRPLDATGHARVSVGLEEHVATLDLLGHLETLTPFVVFAVHVSTLRKGGMTSTVLRDIPVEWCRRKAVEALIGPMPTLEPMTGHRPTREVLEAVLETYRTAEMHMVPPVPEVQKRFGLSKATATRWIARAREEHTHER